MIYREIRAEDAAALQAAFGSLSDDTIYRRFFTSKKELTDDEADYFADVDHERREAFIAVLGKTIIGVARYDRLIEEPDVAEAAIVVQDAYQGRGHGTRLLGELMDRARRSGIHFFEIDRLSDNRAIAGLIGRSVLEPVEDNTSQMGVTSERLRIPDNA